MNFVTYSVNYRRNERQIKLPLAECEVNCAGKAKSEGGKFREMSELSQRVVRNEFTDKFDNNSQKTLAYFFAFCARIGGEIKYKNHNCGG